MKKLFVIAALCAALLLCACGTNAAVGSAEESKQTRIELKGDTASVSGGGAKVSGSTVSISAGGRYVLSGTLDNGQIVVDTGDDAMDVWLALDNASVTNLSGAAVYVKQAKNCCLSTLAGTKNRLVSGTEADLAAFDGTQNGAALLSEDDLKLEGEGSLEILGYINNGVTCKDDLDIKGGEISVFAAGNGLRGVESVEIKGGKISVASGNDGVKASSAKKEGKGFVRIKGGEISITAQGDGIQAESFLEVSGGELTVLAKGDGVEQSSKALKAKTGLLLSGGALTLSAVEDAVKCDADVTVSGGEIRIVSEGDGIQAGDKASGLGAITISGGELGISAERRALNAHSGVTISGGSVLAFIGSDKQEAPDGDAPVLFVPFIGAAGDRITLDGKELEPEAGCAYTSLLYTGDLTAGESYSLSNRLRTISVTAK